MAIWKHLKTGGLYRVLGECVIEDNWVPGIRYQNITGGYEIIRPKTEFYDGRFEHQEPLIDDRSRAIREYLEVRDNQLLARDGPAQDTLEGCELALRDVYLIATGKEPEGIA
jgi:hypothetical protein